MEAWAKSPTRVGPRSSEQNGQVEAGAGTQNQTSPHTRATSQNRGANIRVSPRSRSGCLIDPLSPGRGGVATRGYRDAPPRPALSPAAGERVRGRSAAAGRLQGVRGALRYRVAANHSGRGSY